jgi:NitT/TauT family transport system ATP-binding protein
MSTTTAFPETATESGITVDGVWQRFQRLDAQEPFVALSDVNLEITRGRFVALLGASGCGKSTLLRAISGLTSPTEGVIRHRDEVVRGPHHSRGFVFQADAVFPWLTVRRNIEFGLKSRGIGAAQRRTTAEHWAEIVGLADFLEAYPKELSGGMRKRVDLARVYANDPDVLLMDEPFGALDSQTKERMQLELLNLWEQSRKTVVFVTHDVDEAIFLADEIVVMAARPGRVAEQVPVTLARPRTQETRISEEFDDYRRRIRQLMQSLDVTRNAAH